VLLLPLGPDQAVAQVTPDAANAMQDPVKHAWDLFMVLNHPAQPIDQSRGEPDWSKSIGDPGRVVWETWKLARTEVFLANGCRPPAWDDFSLDETLTAGVSTKTFELPKSLVIQNLAAGAEVTDAFSVEVARNLLHADLPDGLFGLGGGETRMNRATFEFIVNNPAGYELYNWDGQEEFYEAFAAGQVDKLSFPTDSIEVKAMWTLLTDDENQAGVGNRYYLSTGQDGQTYKLGALHIITKDVPKWFWATFRHKEGPAPLLPSVGEAGRPDALTSTIWENYELSGTQTDYVDEIGQATLLSDPMIENGFEASSCISCHALSTIGKREPATSALPSTISFVNTDGHLVSPGRGVTGTAIGVPIGSPNPGWFREPTGFFGPNVQRADYAQMDFLWSMPFRAQRKAATCPN
jgi:hypothetical protein